MLQGNVDHPSLPTCLSVCVSGSFLLLPETKPAWAYYLEPTRPPSDVPAASDDPPATCTIHTPLLAEDGASQQAASDVQASSSAVVALNHASFAWTKAACGALNMLPGMIGQPSLYDISLEVEPRGLTVILGSPGSGGCPTGELALGEWADHKQ